MITGYGNYDKYPEKAVHGFKAVEGYNKITELFRQKVAGKERHVITLELYPEVDIEEILNGLKGLAAVCFNAEECMVSDEEYNNRIRPFLTDDRVFGIMNTLNTKDFYITDKTEAMRKQIAAAKGLVIVYGVGASLVCEGDTLVYADLARWEIQCRFAKGAGNWKSDNGDAPKLAKYGTRRNGSLANLRSPARKPSPSTIFGTSFSLVSSR